MPYKDYNKAKEKAKKYYEKNKEKVKASAIAWRAKNPDAQLYYQAMTSSKARGIEFTISREDIKIPEYCPYLGIKLTNERGKKPSNISIDRIDNTKGYIPGNVQVISYLANRMKDVASIEELVTFSQNVLKLHA